MKVVALAGGIGAARFLRGLVEVVEPGDLTVVVNTADDITLHGLHISPDLDTITYTLGGGVHPNQGWGRAGESFALADELRDRYGEDLWFTLGDRDLATHLLRSRLLAEGQPLSVVTTRIAEAWGLDFTLLPMTDDAVTTRIETADGRDLHFQEWWIREGAKPAVEAVRFAGAETALPAPGVLPAIAGADAVVVCPSNPVVSIGPILAVPGIRATLHHTPVVGISPIVGGAVVRGMADRLLPAVGVEVSAAGVAGLYDDLLDAWVVDDVDAAVVGELGVPTDATDTIMADAGVSSALARFALDHLTSVT